MAKNKIDKIQMSRSARGEVVIEIRDAYDRVFSDASVAKEHLDTAVWFETFGKRRGSGRLKPIPFDRFNSVNYPFNVI